MINQNPLANPKILKTLLTLYILGLVCYSFIEPPFGDSIYYWQWSQHLALGYYDGPPLIAYLLRISTKLFGHNFFALNIIAPVCLGFCGYFIYKIGELVLDSETGWIAVLLWLLHPIVTSRLALRVTYDLPLNLFWAMSIYFVARYIKYHKTSNLYWAGAAIGLMFLSKYAAVVLLMGLLLFFVIDKSIRSLYQTSHFYLAALLGILLFTPAIIWNYQHHWISVTYQLAVHSALNPNSLFNLTSANHYIGNFLGNYFIYIVIPLIALYPFKHQTLPILIKLLLCISVYFFIFWLIASLFISVVISYLSPAIISLSVVCAYYLKKQHYKKTLWVILSVFFICSLFRIFDSYYQDSALDYKLAQQAITTNQTQGPQPIFSYNYSSIDEIIFWANTQAISPLPCVKEMNQYQLWNQDLQTALRERKIKNALYVDFYPMPWAGPTAPACLNEYFAKCTAVPSIKLQQNIPLSHKILSRQIVLYQCTNP